MHPEFTAPTSHTDAQHTRDSVSPVDLLRKLSVIKRVDMPEAAPSVPPEATGLVRSGLEMLAQFLACPIIRDTFSELSPKNPSVAHEIRINWWREQTAEIRDLFTRNKLALNNVGNVLSASETIMLGLGSPADEHIEAMQAFIRESITKDKWLALSDDKKEQFIQDTILPFITDMWAFTMRALQAPKAPSHTGPLIALCILLCGLPMVAWAQEYQVVSNQVVNTSIPPTVYLTPDAGLQAQCGTCAFITYRLARQLNCGSAVPIAENDTDIPACRLVPRVTTIGAVELEWSAVNAATAFIDNGVGHVNLEHGARTITPTADTIYTMTVVNKNGRVASCSAIVKVAVTTPSGGVILPVATSSTTSVGGGDVPYTGYGSTLIKYLLYMLGALLLIGLVWLIIKYTLYGLLLLGVAVLLWLLIRWLF